MMMITFSESLKGKIIFEFDPFCSNNFEFDFDLRNKKVNNKLSCINVRKFKVNKTLRLLKKQLYSRLTTHSNCIFQPLSPWTYAKGVVQYS